MKAPHKQSGDINNPNNFNNHKANSLDKVDGRSLSIWDEGKLREMYEPYISYLKANELNFPTTMFNKYI
jgi:hypothetical protein